MPRKIDPSNIGSSVVNSGVGFGGMSVTINQYNQQQDSFPASSISVTNNTNVYLGDNVESNLDELAGLIVERPPVVGESSKTFSYEALTATHTGVPDWGALKLADSYVWERVNPWTSHTGAVINGIVGMEDNYGNTLAPPVPDEATDVAFNLTTDGSGPGLTYRGNIITASEEVSLVRTSFGDDLTLSGLVYPADRGVLALVHWDLNLPLTVASSVSDIENRVIAAIKLGAGITEDGENNDGEPGGLFVEGEGDVFPSRKTGQYDLKEKLTGLHRITGASLVGGPNNRAGQVRLLTEPSACYFGVDEPTITANGIAILGGDNNAIGGGVSTNFFAYRLPQLKSYEANELFTPQVERGRFFTAYTPTSLTPPLDVELDTAGNYVTMGKNLFGNQVARFRHTVSLASFSPELGSFGLIHFKTEHAFEEFARDGIAPTSDKVWSIHLSDYSAVGENLTETTLNFDDKGFATIGGATITADSNALVRYNLIKEDTEPTYSFNLLEGATTVTYSLSNKDSVMWVSGVPYMTGTADISFSFDITETSASPYFEADSGRVIYYDDDFIPPMAVIAPAIGSNLELDAVAQGVLTTTTDYIKLSGDYITENATSLGAVNIEATLTCLKDTTINGIFPTLNSITQPYEVILNAPFHHRLRKPVATSQYGSILSSGVSSTLLFFSGNMGVVNSQYGNSRVFLDDSDLYEIPLGTGDGGNPSKPSSNILTARKDTQERFLDEAYRIRSNFDGFTFNHYGQVVDNSNLTGPGLPFGMYFYEDFVIRDSNGTEHFNAGWLSNGLHASALPLGEAQVKGLFEATKSRSYSYGTTNLRRGVLGAPLTNYTLAANNFLVAEDSATWQPLCTNYGSLSYLNADARYVRAFDVSFSRSGLVEDVGNKTQFTLRVLGLDFTYFNAPSDKYSIYVKVPGLTTWMNIGRANGTGPSKQSPSLDGAGCCVSYTEGYLKTEGIIYTDVLCDVGPVACLKENILGEVPILVKVVLEQGLSTALKNFSGNSYDTRRGLVGLELLRDSNNKNFDEDGTITI